MKSCASVNQYILAKLVVLCFLITVTYTLALCPELHKLNFYN